MAAWESFVTKVFPLVTKVFLLVTKVFLLVTKVFPLVTKVLPLVTTKGFYYLLKLFNLLKPNKKCDLQFF